MCQVSRTDNRIATIALIAGSIGILLAVVGIVLSRFNNAAWVVCIAASSACLGLALLCGWSGRHTIRGRIGLLMGMLLPAGAVIAIIVDKTVFSILPR